MMRKILSYILLLFFYTNSHAQNTNWEYHYTMGTWTGGHALLEIPNTGYYIFGWNDSLKFDSLNAPLYDQISGLAYKVDYNGFPLDSLFWNYHDTNYFQMYNSISDNVFEGAQLLPDNNILVIGETQSYSPSSLYDYDLWMIKFSQNLDTLWSKTYSVPDSQIIAARTELVISTNNEIVSFGRKTPFSSLSYPNVMPYIARFDSSGNLMSDHTIQGLGFSGISGLVEVGDGSYMITCYRQNSNSFNDFSPQIAHVAADYSILWDTILPFDHDLNEADGIVKTYDDKYVYSWIHVASNPGALNKVWIYHSTKIDINGNIFWDKTYGYSFDGQFKVLELSNHDLLFYGQTTDTITFKGKGLLMRCNENGDTLWVSKIGDSGILCNKVCTTSDGGFLLTGQIYGYNFTPNIGQTSSLWIAKVDSLGLLTSLSNEITPNLSNFILNDPFPNPAHDYITVKIDTSAQVKRTQNIIFIYDQSGKRIATYPLESSLNELRVDAQNLSCGSYLFALSINGYNAGIKKWIKE